MAQHFKATYLSMQTDVKKLGFHSFKDIIGFLSCLREMSIPVSFLSVKLSLPFRCLLWFSFVVFLGLHFCSIHSSRLKRCLLEHKNIRMTGEECLVLLLILPFDPWIERENSTTCTWLGFFLLQRDIIYCWFHSLVTPLSRFGRHLSDSLWMGNERDDEKDSLFV